MTLPAFAVAQASPDQEPFTAPTTAQSFEPGNLNIDQQGLPEEQASERMAARGTHGGVQVLDADGIRQTLIDVVQVVTSNDLTTLPNHLAAGTTVPDLNSAPRKLAPVLSRLKRDFERHYNEPLEYTPRPETVINSHFFEIGNAYGLAPAVGNRDAATAIIHARDDLDRADIAVVRQNGQWLIRLSTPAAKQLTERLDQALRWMDQRQVEWPATPTAARREIAHAILMAFAPVPA